MSCEDKDISQEVAPLAPQVDSHRAFRELQRQFNIDDQMRYRGPHMSTAQLMEGAELIFIERQVITRDAEGNITNIEFTYERPDSVEVSDPEQS